MARGLFDCIWRFSFSGTFFFFEIVGQWFSGSVQMYRAFMYVKALLFLVLHSGLAE
jgi:hypothetical protein